MEHAISEARARWIEVASDAAVEAMNALAHDMPTATYDECCAGCLEAIRMRLLTEQARAVH